MEVESELSIDHSTVMEVQFDLTTVEVTLLFFNVPTNWLNKLCNKDCFSEYEREELQDSGCCETNKNTTDVIQYLDEESNSYVALEQEDPQGNFQNLITNLNQGIDVHAPELCEEGVNGTYFLKDKEGKMIAVFKPKDEEAGSANSPKNDSKNHDDISQDKGIPLGGTPIREVAAYLLDSEGFYGVPRTTMASVKHDIFQSSDGSKLKVGSLQEFVENDGAAWDVGPAKFPTNEVHKIGILDLQIMNTDRHEGNILLQEMDDGRFSLTPIDHGFSFPGGLDKALFIWQQWPQSKIPFDEKTKAHISRIDVDSNESMLRELGLQDEYLKTMRISTTLLKKGAASDLTLHQIAEMVCRPSISQPSKLEQIYEEARKQDTNETGSLEILFELMDREIKLLKKN